MRTWPHPQHTQNLLYSQEFEHDACGTGFVATLHRAPTHAVVQKAIQCVINLTHRGAVGADARTGDGAGILTQLPRALFTKTLQSLNRPLPPPGDLAVGMCFLPRENLQDRERCRAIIEDVVSHLGIEILGWRQVPVDASVLGDKAASTQPEIEQVLMARGRAVAPEAFEQTLYLARKTIERQAADERISDVYLPSFSSQRLVYKGLFVAPQLPQFYLDLRDPSYESALAVFHQRYSTNTFPTWTLAQPFRFLAHNGEINTLRGNRNWMRAREPELHSSIWKKRIERLTPVIVPEGSDSAALDNVWELLAMSGRDTLHAAMMLIPEAWEHMPDMDPELRAFYQFHAALQEPWDGPAAIAFSDGRVVGALLDRNGLRPARYVVTNDGLIIMGSEVGCVEVPAPRVARKGRLGPGRMIAVDTATGAFWSNEEIKQRFTRAKPYATWISQQLTVFDQRGADPEADHLQTDATSVLQQETAFGYTREDWPLLLQPMVASGQEAVGSMGDDAPLSVLSHKPRLLYTYFKQLFAQVTNPPIDSLREKLVMSHDVLLGPRQTLLEETDAHTKLVHLSTPLLFNHELDQLRALPDPVFKSETLSTLFRMAGGVEALPHALLRLCASAVQAVDNGASLLILSDRGVDEAHAALPMLLAIGAVHHHLIREGRRMRASLIVETGDAREIHHMAVLIGYGASAVNPYLAFDVIRQAVLEGKVPKLDLAGALVKYRESIEKGLLKIMSKMGISTLSSYHGAQIFEAVGLSRPLVEDCFTGTPSRIGGITLREIAEDVLAWHRGAFGTGTAPTLDIGGDYHQNAMPHGGEAHAFNTEVVRALRQAARTADPTQYQRFATAVNHREPLAIRDLLAFKPGRPIPVDEVEPAESIVTRFVTASISHGAIGAEAHQTMAIAMNRLGAKSGSGEGGEDKARFHVRPNGDLASSAIKQVASARFGVTPEYLVSAKVLQIKMAQGSKPGEGGQLPGFKVSEEIARLRHATPGTQLISPPPHHDIYSIEDLAQLIYDLKQANPQAIINVKLVAEAGVGTIAAGVAKGYADSILISGHDGGTGASPRSSIKHAGLPWELGLAETQQTLVLNDLRGRVRLQTDGGLKTGRDVVIAALLGADEFGFGTAPLVAMGCIMARQCHLNTCPVGVATQDPALRAKFDGTPEMVVTYLLFIAQEVREILASLGSRTLADVIGRVDLLQVKPLPRHGKAERLDLSALLAQVDPHGTKPHRCVQPRNDRAGDAPLDLRIIQDAREALEGRSFLRLAYPINNTNRSVGTRLSAEIARRYGDRGLLDGAIECIFRGSAGQSFGAFLITGVRLVLLGEANDYVGKGMAGGEIVIRPPEKATFPSQENVLLGNTVLYGATGGTLFAAGLAGERFCVRNSGATAVVEGVGDHGCEYMTGGLAVILGPTGRNFAAGMSGGLAFVLDQDDRFDGRCNTEMVSVGHADAPEDRDRIRALIAKHAEATGSLYAKRLLSDWARTATRFKKVTPHPPIEVPMSKTAAPTTVGAR